MANGNDEIIFTFEDDFGVPSLIDRDQVTISATMVTNEGASGESVSPQAVTIEIVGTEKDEEKVSLRIPDMDTSDGSGGNGIGAGAIVTVVFRQAAGITNGSEGHPDGYRVQIRATTGW